jgi:hypothetical protein
VPLNNAEQEGVWIDAWNVLSDLIEEYPNSHILLPEYKEANKPEAEGWIQDAAYGSNRIEFRVNWFKGKKSIYISKIPA